MPLDNKKLTPEIVEYLCGIPLDEEARECLQDLPHQTKVDIYDKRCSGCGFIRIEVGDKVFRSLPEAIDIARATGLPITRTCEYPSDVEMVFGKPKYPSLTTIVVNTCRFWYSQNIEGEEDEERLPK